MLSLAFAQDVLVHEGESNDSPGEEDDELYNDGKYASVRGLGINIHSLYQQKCFERAMLWLRVSYPSQLHALDRLS